MRRRKTTAPPPAASPPVVTDRATLDQQLATSRATEAYLTAQCDAARDLIAAEVGHLGTLTAQLATVQQNRTRLEWQLAPPPLRVRDTSAPAVLAHVKAYIDTRRAALADDWVPYLTDTWAGATFVRAVRGYTLDLDTFLGVLELLRRGRDADPSAIFRTYPPAALAAAARDLKTGNAILLRTGSPAVVNRMAHQVATHLRAAPGRDAKAADPRYQLAEQCVERALLDPSLTDAQVQADLETALPSVLAAAARVNEAVVATWGASHWRDARLDAPGGRRATRASDQRTQAPRVLWLVDCLERHFLRERGKRLTGFALRCAAIVEPDELTRLRAGTEATLTAASTETQWRASEERLAEQVRKRRSRRRSRPRSRPRR